MDEAELDESKNGLMRAKNRLLLIVFQIKLALYLILYLTRVLVATLLHLAWKKRASGVVFLLSGVVVIALAIAITLYHYTGAEPVNNLDNTSAFQVSTLKNISLSRPEADQLLNLYLSQLQKQPTHRDLIINTALLLEATNQSNEAGKFWQRALEVDPNHPVLLEASTP